MKKHWMAVAGLCLSVLTAGAQAGVSSTASLSVDGGWLSDDTPSYSNVDYPSLGYSPVVSVTATDSQVCSGCIAQVRDSRELIGGAVDFGLASSQARARATYGDLQTFVAFDAKPKQENAWSLSTTKYIKAAPSAAASFNDTVVISAPGSLQGKQGVVRFKGVLDTSVANDHLGYDTTFTMSGGGRSVSVAQGRHYTDVGLHYPTDAYSYTSNQVDGLETLGDYVSTPYLDVVFTFGVPFEISSSLSSAFIDETMGPGADDSASHAYWAGIDFVKNQQTGVAVKTFTINSFSGTPWKLSQQAAVVPEPESGGLALLGLGGLYFLRSRRTQSSR
jgi:MYXO-CTERM domain-containing protein